MRARARMCTLVPVIARGVERARVRAPEDDAWASTGLLEEEGDLAGALALFKGAADQRCALGAFLVGWAMLHREWKVATKSVGLPRDPSVRA